MWEQLLDEEERNELDVLRLENDTLRRNLGKLEEKVSLAEEHVHAMGVTEASQEEGSKKGGGGAFNMGQSVQLEVNQLHGILQWLQEAKAEFVENDRSKVQLERDVRLLYHLLERARSERRHFDATIKALRKSVAECDGKNVQLEQELKLQRRSFKRVLRKDRDAYEARTTAAENQAERRAQELQGVMSWVEEADSKYADALGKLSAMAEEIGAANLGDLEGFARDMSEEVRQIRQGVSEAMGPRSGDGSSNTPNGRRRRKKNASLKTKNKATRDSPAASTEAEADLNG